MLDREVIRRKLETAFCEPDRLRSKGLLTAIVAEVSAANYQASEELTTILARAYHELIHFSVSSRERKENWSNALSTLWECQDRGVYVVGYIANFTCDYIRDEYLFLGQQDKIRDLVTALHEIDEMLKIFYANTDKKEDPHASIEQNEPPHVSKKQFAFLLSRKSAILRHKANLVEPVYLNEYESDYTEIIHQLEEAKRSAIRAREICDGPEVIMELVQIDLDLLRFRALHLKPNKRYMFFGEYLNVINGIEELFEQALDQSEVRDLVLMGMCTFYKAIYRPYDAIEVFRQAIACTGHYRRLLRESYLYGESLVQIWYKDRQSFIVSKLLPEAMKILDDAIEAGYTSSRISLAKLFLQRIAGEEVDDSLLLDMFSEGNSVDVNRVLDEIIENPEIAENVIVRSFANGIDQSTVWSKLGTYYLDFNEDRRKARMCYDMALLTNKHNVVALTNSARFRIQEGTAESLKEAQSMIDRIKNNSDLMFRWWSNLEDEFRIAQRALMGNGSSSAKPLKRGRKKLEDVRNVNQLRDVVLSLDKVTAQQRGYRFEEVVARLCELTSGIAKLNVWKRGRDDDHNQIDVYFRFKRAGGGEIPFYVECKWESTAANKDQLEKFHTALGSTQYGLFISMGGFEETGIRRARRLAQDKPILLVDGKEMMAVLDGRIPFKVLLDTKIRYLEEISEPYYSLVIEEHEPSY